MNAERSKYDTGEGGSELFNLPNELLVMIFQYVITENQMSKLLRNIES